MKQFLNIDYVLRESYVCGAGYPIHVNKCRPMHIQCMKFLTKKLSNIIRGAVPQKQLVEKLPGINIISSAIQSFLYHLILLYRFQEIYPTEQPHIDASTFTSIMKTQSLLDSPGVQRLALDFILISKVSLFLPFFPPYHVPPVFSTLPALKGRNQLRTLDSNPFRKDFPTSHKKYSLKFLRISHVTNFVICCCWV